MQIGPQAMHFKIGFIHFDRRTLSFAAILRNQFDHILISEKIVFFRWKFWADTILFLSYVHEHSVSATEIAPLRQAN